MKSALFPVNYVAHIEGRDHNYPPLRVSELSGDDVAFSEATTADDLDLSDVDSDAALAPPP